MNNLTKILEAFPNGEYTWYGLSANPNIDLNYMVLHPEFNWQLDPGHPSGDISENPNINIDYVIRKLPETRHPNTFLWNISRNPGIKLQDIETHSNLNFDWCSVSENPNITIDFVLKHIDKIRTDFLGRSPNITLEHVEQYPHLFPEKNNLSYNPNLTLDYVLNNKDVNWWWHEIGKHQTINFYDVKNKCPEFLNSYDFMRGLSCNPNITMDIVNENPSYDWDFDFLCDNPSITMDDIETFYDKLSDKDHLFANPNITLDWIHENEEKYPTSFFFLSFNQFHCHPYFDEPIIIRI